MTPTDRNETPADYRAIWNGRPGWVRYDLLGWWRFWPDDAVDHFGPGQPAYIFSGGGAVMPTIERLTDAD